MQQVAPFELHLMNATGGLGPVVSLLHGRIRAAHATVAPYLPLNPLDIVVMTGRDVDESTGHAVFTPAADRIFVTVDPDNPALMADADRSLERMIARELHHAARRTGPGYGTTLGEVLVSEGLACRFVREIYGPPAEPEAATVSPYTVKQYLRRVMAEWIMPCDHDAWFMGGGDLPAGLGQAVGAALVDARIGPQDSTVMLAHSPTARFFPD